MKAFRGAVLAATAAAALGISIWMMDPEVITEFSDLVTSDGSEDVEAAISDTPLIQFEAHELIAVRVERPSGDVIVLSEGEDGSWGIEGQDYVAGRSMVNRLRHQFHDLTPRTLVTEAVDDPDLYGLGTAALRVTLTLRNGQETQILVGHPNPTNVSYYVQPLPGTAVYTVQKASVDYLSGDLDQFREKRFAKFRDDQVNRIEIECTVEGAIENLMIARTGDEGWRMESPLAMEASHQMVQRLIGRVTALKAMEFVDEDEQNPSFGFDTPRAVWTLTLESGETLTLEVGGDAPGRRPQDELKYMRLNQQGTVYVSRSSLLEELQRAPEEFRNRRVVPLRTQQIVNIEAVLRAEEGETLAGRQEVVHQADEWLWTDGVPVSGQTPERLAKMMADVQVSEFVDDQPTDVSAFGFDEPVARVWLKNTETEILEVQFGDPGPPQQLEDGRQSQQRYMRVMTGDSIYLVEESVLKVVRDLIREGNRKDKSALEKAELRAMGQSSGSVD